MHARDYGLVAVLLLAAILRAAGIGFGLPHTLARPDEDAAVTIALRFFTRTLNPDFFDWPSLFMYAVAALFVLYFNVGRWMDWFSYEGDFIALAPVYPAPLFLLARTVSVVTGVATVWTVHRIGAVLFDRPTALVSAFFMAVAPLHVRDSHFGVTDVPATWLVTVSFLWTAAFARSRRPRAVILAALFAGLAASTKYNAALIALPAVWVIARARVESVPRRVARVAVFGGVATAAFFAGTPYALFEWQEFLASLSSISAHLRDGHVADAGPAWLVHLTSSLRYGLGLPMLLTSAAGFVLILWRRPDVGTSVALFPLTYFVIIGMGRTAFARYIIPVLPFCCIAAGYAVTTLAMRLAARTQAAAALGAVAAGLAAMIALPAMTNAVRTDWLLAQTDNRLIAAEWIHRAFPHGASMYQSGSTYGHVQMRTAGYSIADRYPQFIFDEATGKFLTPDHASAMPDLIVIQRSPLAYSEVPPGIGAIASTHYVLRQTFHAVLERAPHLVYDADDAFYVPLSGFEAVERPGPNLDVYVKNGR
jgi:hypothetical protein